MQAFAVMRRLRKVSRVEQVLEEMAQFCYDGLMIQVCRDEDLVYFWLDEEIVIVHFAAMKRWSSFALMS